MFLGQVPFYCRFCKNEFVEDIWNADGTCYVQYQKRWLKAVYDGYGEYVLKKTNETIVSDKAICMRCYKALKKKID